MLDEADPTNVAEILDTLGERATKWLDDEGISGEARSVSHVADMRYHRQGYEIPVPVDPENVRKTGLGDLEERFNQLHEQLYGFRMPDTRCEIVNLRAVGAGSVPKPELPTGKKGKADASEAVYDEHDIVVEGNKVSAKIYDRAKLKPGARFDGPAIVTEFDSTTLVLPGYTAQVDTSFNILIDKS